MMVENLRLKTHKKCSSIFVFIPAKFCSKVGITGEDSEFVDIVVHQLVKSDRIIDLEKLIIE